MAAKKQEDFTANFAHELKTPMTSIIGYADTLYQKKMSEDEVHSAAGVILNEGMRLEALSFKLLELITLDKNDFRLEETRVSEIIADCVETAHEAARKHNTEIVYSADEAWVWLEYDLFKTMLLNDKQPDRQCSEIRRQQGRCIRQTYFAKYLSYCSFGQWKRNTA